ncbi:hypothetical protein Pint_15545 [Pistacia integerrima]|uniref:Uncharacterized protein n=1 Tax=Pistacia integerrima TaxID=434235 RepID=A0ACC0ZAN1_9ROSI|nr:hypothetical protein Pint_15545 [Pistacia integerrima]
MAMLPTSSMAGIRHPQIIMLTYQELRKCLVFSRMSPSTPSTLMFHKAFKNNYTSGEEEEQQPPKSKKSSPKANKKVQLSDHAEIVDSNISDENCEVQQETIETEADGFIQKKRKGFELCKWKTFKLH